MLFDFGFFQIRWYALAYIFGLMGAWQYVRLLLKNDRLWAEKDASKFPREKTIWRLPLVGAEISVRRFDFPKKIKKQFQVNPPASIDHVDDLLLWAAMGVIVGGRLGYIALYAMWQEPLRDYYLSNPLSMLAVWQGGMSFHGGLLGVIIATLLFSKLNKLDAFRVGDIMAPAVPIGLFFGRLANYINAELWGKVTTVPWGVIFPNGGPLPRHPSQLYEAGLEGLFLFGLLFVLTYHTRLLQRPGTFVGIFLIVYGLSRVLVEFVREQTDVLISETHWFTIGMGYSMVMVAVGVAFILRANILAKKDASPS